MVTGKKRGASENEPQNEPSRKKYRSHRKARKSEQQLIIEASKQVTKTQPKYKEKTAQSSWSLSATSGGRLLDCDPVFVSFDDEQYLIAATSHEVRLLSIHTSLTTRSYAPEEEIIDFTTQGDVVFLALINNSIVSWNWKTGESLSEHFKTNASVVALVSFQSTLIHLGEHDGQTGIFSADGPLYHTKFPCSPFSVMAATLSPVVLLPLCSARLETTILSTG